MINCAIDEMQFGFMPGFQEKEQQMQYLFPDGSLGPYAFIASFGGGDASWS